MATKTKQVNIEFRSTGTEKVKSEVRQIENGVASLNRAFSFLGVSLSVGAVFQGFKFMINQAIEAENALNKLKFALEGINKPFANLSGGLDKTISYLAKVTNYSKSELTTVLADLIMLTGDYDKAIKSLNIAIDLAATGWVDLGTATRMTAMAMEGNIEVLSRIHPAFRNLTEELGKNATEAERVNYFLQKVNESISGQAIQNAKTYSGIVKQLWEDFSEWIEGYGAVFLQIIEDLNKAYESQEYELVPYYRPGAYMRRKKEGPPRPPLPEFGISEEGFYELPSILKPKTWQFATREANAYKETIRGIEMNFKMLDDTFNTAMPRLDEDWNILRNQAEKFSELIRDSIVEQWREGISAIEAFKNAFIAAIEAMVAEIIARAAIFGLVSGILGLPVLGPAANFIFGGFRQGGGRVEPGRAYIVGERGPEVFIPSQSGTVSNNIKQNITIVTSDPKSFEQWLRENNGGKTIQKLLAEV